MQEYRRTIGLISWMTAMFVGINIAAAALDFPPPIRGSEAYQGYKIRNPSELSKIIYLIDRCKGTKIQILYDGTYYSSEIAIPIARWFLSVYYRNQTAEQWIKQYCTSTALYGNPIRVKLPDGTFRPSRDLLLEELASLKHAEDEDEQRSV